MTEEDCFSFKPEKRIILSSGFQIVLKFLLKGLWFLSDLFIPGLYAASKSYDKLPNIVIILADDLGYGDLGGYYNGRSKTPNLNRLAQEGMLFTDFHSNGPTCSPTRASLITGRYPQRLGVETAQRNVLDMPQNKDEITVAGYLKKAGYSTGIFGKWHLGRPQEGNPVRFGFNKFIGYFGGDLDYFSKIDRYGNKDWWYNEDLFDEKGYVTQLITRHSVQFIKENKNIPFFLYISHLACHFPWQGPEDGNLWTRLEGNDYTSSLAGPRNKLGPHSPDSIPCVLSRMIEELDQSVGTIIGTLREQNLDKNTLVFFISDNGQYIDYGNMWPKVGSNGPLRGQKGDVWEGGHRIPAIAWWPGHIPPLSVSSQTIMTMDILPTLLDLLGISLPPEKSPNQLDGISILPVLFKEEESLKSRDLFWRVNKNKAIRHGPWKLVIQDESANLYNLNKDIGETTDLFSLYPDIAGELKKKMIEWEKNVTK